MALRDTDGTLLGLITHNRDITEKRLLDHDLYQVRQTLDDAITNMNDGLAIYQDGRLIFCNDHYCSHFPLTCALRVPGAKLTDIMRASLARSERVGNQDVDQRWLGSISGDQFSRHEDVLEMSDGRWLQLKSVSVKGGVLFLVSDISETRRAQAELEASHAAITENKRLGDVLAYIKERQEKLPMPKVKTNSEKNGYTPRGRKPGRRTDLLNDPAVVARREKAVSRLDAAE